MSMMACKKCRQLFPSVKRATVICPNCKAKTLSENWSGLVIILDPEGSEVAKTMGFEKEGAYAVKVGR